MVLVFRHWIVRIVERVKLVCEATPLAETAALVDSSLCEHSFIALIENTISTSLSLVVNRLVVDQSAAFVPLGPT